jgi:hypothetical protein
MNLTNFDESFNIREIPLQYNFFTYFFKSEVVLTTTLKQYGKRSHHEIDVLVVGVVVDLEI